MPTQTRIQKAAACPKRGHDGRLFPFLEIRREKPVGPLTLTSVVPATHRGSIR
jgi:hypothetical protein